MTEPSSTIYVSLIIRGQVFLPDKISEEIKVKPTKSYIIGDKKRKNIEVFYDQNGWYYSKESFNETDSVDDVVMRLIYDIRHATNELKHISNDMDVTLSIAIYKKNDWPIIRLSNSALLFLGEIGAKVDFDIYA
jgi:hypothetical protein